MSKYDGLTKGDERALKALGVKRLPSGERATKPFRFTLPIEVAEQFEAMSKAERDALVKNAILSK